VYPPGPPAGWYPDPGGSGGWRWWDGSIWTPHLTAPSGPPRSAVPSLVAAELRMVPWALASAAVLGILAALNSAFLLAAVPHLHAFGHWWHQAANNAGTQGYTAPPPPGFVHGSGVSLEVDGVGLLEIPALVLLLVWQYRAAQAARAAGYPATHSPGWGVGSWFVPVVDLWMPFQALRDCLPPGTRHRNRVWVIPALWVTGVLAGMAGFFTAVFAPSGGTPLLVVSAVAEVGMYAVALDVVRRTSAAHRSLVGDTT